MCYSAEASFTISGMLAPAGVYCVQAAARANPSYLPFATFPIIFSIQQFCEGLVWLGLQRKHAMFVELGSIGFLFFAFVFWLFWVPLSAAVLEARPKAKRLFFVLALCGLAIGLGLYLPLAMTPGLLKVHVVGHSIQYDCSALPAILVVPREPGHVIYLAIVFAPLFVLADRSFRLFAISLAASATVTHFVFWYAFESVWCFFAALLSMQLCFLVSRLPRIRE